MAEQVGEIYYDVDIRTQEFLTGAEKLDGSLNKLDRSMGRTESSAKGVGSQMTRTAAGVKAANGAAAQAQSAFGGLYKILAAYVGLQTVQTLIGLSDEYGQMASRVKQVTKDTAEYEKVQARLLQTANATYRPLAEAQEVFIRTADSIRDLGYTTDQALDITDSFSFLLVTNAASADRANSAISAYSKSIQTGRIASEQWQSILAAMPTVVDGIAAATGRSREEIKKLGVEGKLSLDALNEGLRRSRDENEALADEMETSVQDAFTALRNSLQVFVGKVNETSGATGILTAAVGDLAEILQDPATIKAAQELAAGVVQALKSIIAGMKETVEFVRWGAESIAAALHGAASDDIVRLEQQAKELRELQKTMSFNPLARARITGNGVEWFDDAEIEKRLKGTEALIQEFYDRQNKRPPIPIGVEEPKPDPKDAQIIEAQAAATEKKAKARKTLTAADKEAAAAARELQRAQESDAKTLADLQEALYQTTLTTEQLRDRKAELSLSGYATPEQIEQVKALNRELAATEELQKRRASFGEGDVRSKIIGNVSPLSGGQFDGQQERYEAERKAEAERYAEQQQRLVEALELQLVTKEEYQALELEMYQAHSDRMYQIDKARTDMQLQTWAQGFGQMSQDLSAFAAQFADENSAMFKVAKAAAVAQAIINTYQAATGAMAAMSAIPIVGPALGIAAAAAAVAGGMAQVAAIRSQSAPGRLYGGPVQAGGAYRINENGAPEVYQAANGRQYMLPNSRGEVISNADATSQGGGYGQQAAAPITVNQTVNVTGEVSRYTAKQLARKTEQKQRVARSRLG
jgi:tape measure domain-containing protein